MQDVLRDKADTGEMKEPKKNLDDPLGSLL